MTLIDYRALCEELADKLAACWPSTFDPPDCLKRARAALVEPEPEVVEPTDEELLELTEDWPATTGPRHDLSGCPEVPLYSVFADEVVEFARAVLARWGRPAPVPVSERLPGPEDCDAEGRCWVHQPHEACPESPAWELMLAKYASANYEAVCWLPVNALPLPQGEVE